MKRFWAEILKRKKSSFAILISGIMASTFAVIQISSDVDSILKPNENDKVNASVEAGSISDFVNNSKGLAQECSYAGLWLRNANGAVTEISEGRWLSESPSGDTEFKFRCVNMSIETEFSITNLELTKPGSIKIDGIVSKGYAKTLSIAIVSQDKEQNWCGSETISFDLNQDADNFARFESTQEIHDSARKYCRFVYPSSFVTVQQGTDLQKSTVLSRKIDSYIVKATPKNCSYIGATVNDSSNLPNGEDKEFADFINANYLSDESFGGSSPSEDQYRFDPSLGFKLKFYPKWIWTCKGSGVDYAEINLGGYSWTDGNVTRPPTKSFVAFFNPWTQSEVRASATIESFDKNLKSCGIFQLDLSTSTDVDGWQRFNKTIRPGKSFDSRNCRVFTLRTIDIQG